jgi:uncharacterized small protein (DUF1192 family)
MSQEPTKLVVVNFKDAYDVGILHDRIRELEAEVEMLKAQLSDGMEEMKAIRQEAEQEVGRQCDRANHFEDLANEYRNDQ